MGSAIRACPRCAAPQPPGLSTGPDCIRCRSRRYAFQEALALGIYQGQLREAVLRMKRTAHEPLTLAVGELLADKLLEAGWTGRRFQLIVPTPMHWLRRMLRGTNTVQLLSEVTARRLQLPLAPRLLKCRRKTRKQGTLLTQERFLNVRDAFRLSTGYDIRGARVLIIDDILTTGATVSEVARTLRRAGAATIAVAVVARGVGLDQRRL